MKYECIPFCVGCFKNAKRVGVGQIERSKSAKVSSMIHRITAILHLKGSNDPTIGKNGTNYGVLFDWTGSAMENVNNLNNIKCFEIVIYLYYSVRSKEREVLLPTPDCGL